MIEIFIINIMMCLAAIGAAEIIYKTFNGE